MILEPRKLISALRKTTANGPIPDSRSRPSSTRVPGSRTRSPRAFHDANKPTRCAGSRSDDPDTTRHDPVATWMGNSSERSDSSPADRRSRERSKESSGREAYSFKFRANSQAVFWAGRRSSLDAANSTGDQRSRPRPPGSDEASTGAVVSASTRPGIPCDSGDLRDWRPHTERRSGVQGCDLRVRGEPATRRRSRPRVRRGASDG